MRPKAILLLGSVCYAQFYRHMLGVTSTMKLEAMVAGLQDLSLLKYDDALVVPFFHPSPASPKFLGWFRNWGSRLNDSPLVRRLTAALGR